MKVDDILFRPSSLGKIMTGVAKGWDIEHSLTCKKELVKMYRQIKYDRYYNHYSKYTDKGIKQEHEGILLYNRLYKTNYSKNLDRFNNLWFTGEPDIITSRPIVDIKCVWGVDTLPHPSIHEIDEDYEYQGYGYMDLLERDIHIVAYCLVNATADQINKEKSKMYYRLDQPDPRDPFYIKELIKIEKNMIFDLKVFNVTNPGYNLECKDWNFDIPVHERVVEFVVHRNERKLNAVKNRIIAAREWMLHNLISPPENNVYFQT